MMKRSLAFAVAFLAASGCQARDNPQEPLGFLAPACIQKSQAVNIRVAKSAFGLPKMGAACLAPRSQWLPMRGPVNISPYRNGLADVSLVCNSRDANEFYVKEAGQQIYFVFDDEVVGGARVAASPTSSSCSVKFLPTLKEAIAICETIGRTLRAQTQDCWTPCDSRQRWACITHK